MKSYCAVALDYLGVKPLEAEVSLDHEVDDRICGYYVENQPDSDHPYYGLPRVCGNCKNFIVLKN